MTRRGQHRCLIRRHPACHDALGIAAAAGLDAYSLGALTGHLPVGDTQGATMPLPPALTTAALALRILTL